MSKKKTITKDTVPEGFTVFMALVDLMPVAFFGESCIEIGKMFSSLLFISGAVICLLSGALKVLWKFIVVLKKKNVWPLFVQMRIAMPAGLLIMTAAAVIEYKKISFPAIWSAVTGFPSVIFFVIGLIGIILMIVFAAKLDSADSKSNWIEQLTNGIAQLCIYIGILLI